MLNFIWKMFCYVALIILLFYLLPLVLFFFLNVIVAFVCIWLIVILFIKDQVMKYKQIKDEFKGMINGWKEGQITRPLAKTNIIKYEELG